MNKTYFAKLVNGALSYAPNTKGNVLGYNLASNKTHLLEDGYKPVEFLKNKEKYSDCEGSYSFYFEEEEDKIIEKASYSPYDYSFLRQKAYPSVADLCDALVKLNSNDENLKAEGQTQLDAYVQNCLGVKQKYPKP